MAGSLPEQDAEQSDPLAMHRRHWSESLDLDVTALVFSLHRAHRAVSALAVAVWGRHGLTAAEFDVLATLRRSPPPRELTPSGIQAALAITSGGLTKVMSKLEARGLVTRSRNEGDQRVKPVRLSDEGRRLVEAAMAEVNEVSSGAVRARLADEEIAAVTTLLEKLATCDGGDSSGD